MSPKDTITAIDTTPAWKALLAHHAKVKDVHLRDLFAKDPDRATRMTAEGAGLFLDYSKHRATGETIALLLDVARAAEVEGRRDDTDAGLR